MKHLLSYLKKSILPAFVIVLFFSFIISIPVSCKLDSAGTSLLKGDFTAPQIESFLVTSASSVSLDFTKKIREATAVIKKSGDDSFMQTSVNWNDMHTTGTFFTPQKMVPGVQYILTGVVKDDTGNSLTMQIPFSGYNENPASLVFAEIRNAYSSKKQQYEYVKFYCTKSGNLSGFEFVNAGDGEQHSYAFPSIEVKKGEYVCIHLRKMKSKETGEYMQKGMIDETEGNKNTSFAVDSSSDTWDLWQENEKSRLSPSDILLLRNKNTNTICDVFIYRDAKKENATWSNSYSQIEKEALLSGIWKDSNGNASTSWQSGFVADGITNAAVTRSMLRRNYKDISESSKVSSSAKDWYVYTKKK